MLKQGTKKLNIIFLINNPSDREDDPIVTEAYEHLKRGLQKGFHDDHRILILRYSLDEKAKNRRLRLLELTPDGELMEQTISNQQDFGNVKFTEPIFLGLLFQYIRTVYISSHTILITWGHGFGVGLFKNRSFSFNTEKLFAADYTFNKRHLFDSIASSSQDDPESNFDMGRVDLTDMLTNTELNDALKISYRSNNPDDPNNKIDLLLFMNCDMMRLDTVYDLAMSIKYIVGPQTPISFIGYNYAALLEFINTNINYLHNETTWVNLCQNITEEFKNAYISFDDIQKEYVNRTVISAIDTKKFDQIFETLNRLLLDIISSDDLRRAFLDVAGELSKKDDTSNSWGNDPESPIPSERGFCFDLCNFDLLYILERFSEKVPAKKFPATVKLITELLLLISSAIISLKPGEGEFRKNFRGLSVTMPTDIDELESHPFFKIYNMVGTNDRDAFAYLSFWPDFLSLIYKIPASMKFLDKTRQKNT
ncbi:MAG TPA: clostripain-related cysteine peptidase [Ferruginibacter sp.]|nr:clostripain-related cysteine peptidase [Ferruginibacter sp.]